MPNISFLKKLNIPALFIFITITAYIYRAVFYNIPNWYDIWLFLPLVRNWAGVGPKELSPDLLYLGGQEIPFNLYKAYAFLIKIGFAEALVLELSFFISFLLTGYAVFKISELIINNKNISLLVVLLFGILPGSFLTFNWHIAPVQAPVSASFGYPLALLQIFYTFTNSPLKSGFAGLLNSIIHPSFTIIGVFLSVVIYIFNNLKKLSRTNYLSLSLISSPAVVVVGLSLNGVSYQNIDVNEFFKIFELFSHHLYPDSHIRDGWGVFFVTVSICAFLCKINIPRFYYPFLLLTLSSLSLYIVSLINLEFIKSIPFALFFPARGLTLLEPFALAILTHSFFEALSNKNLKRLLGICWIIFGNVSVGEYTNHSVDSFFSIFSLIGLIAVLDSYKIFQHIRNLTFIVIIFIMGNYLLYDLKATSSLFISFLLIGYSVLLSLFASNFSTSYKGFTLSRIISEKIACLITFSILFLSLVQLDKMTKFSSRMTPSCDGSAKESFEWIKSNSELSSVVVVPPNDPIAITARICSERKVYITYSEINQIAYSPKLYKEAYRRIHNLGMILDTLRTSILVGIEFPDYPKRVINIIDNEIKGSYGIIRASECNLILHSRVKFKDNNYCVVN